MKIVVLDGHTTNPGDISWGPLEALGTLEVFERSAPEDVAPRCAGADVILTNKTVLDAATISGLDSARFIGVLATGYNVVDVDAARERGIPVCNAPAYSSDSVAQMVFAHVLNFTQRVAQNAALVAEGRWNSCPDFCFWDQPLTELSGKTFGVVGWGGIGQATGRLARAFGMDVLVHTRTVPEAAEEGIRFGSLEELWAESDVISLHCPLTEATERMVNAAAIDQMKEGVLLINTGRGPLLHEGDVLAAVQSGKLGGVGLDVLTCEPPSDGNPLIGQPGVVVTPHIGWASREARERLVRITAGNVSALVSGSAINVVNGVG